MLVDTSKCSPINQTKTTLIFTTGLSSSVTGQPFYKLGLKTILSQTLLYQLTEILFATYIDHVPGPDIVSRSNQTFQTYHSSVMHLKV